MRKWIALVLLLPSSLANAETLKWDNIYLANTGGSRMWQVDPSDAEMVTAFVDGKNGYRLIVMCSGSGSWLQIGGKGSEPFMGTSSNVEAVFEDDPSIKIGKFSFAGGSYSARLQPQLFAKLLTKKRVYVFNETGDFSDDFTLRGSSHSINSVRCLGGKQ